LKIISLESTSEDLIINKSKFIGLSFIITTRDSALEKIKCLQSAHPSCSHIAYAYQTYLGNSIEPYFNDAGEPSGTAGKPLLNILENQNIVNTCLAVVRYYGGVNLGTGGLARAYSKAGMLALKRSKVTDFTLNNYYLLLFIII
jgi:putative IMPACT (imprinted ancient) family translation regulator